MAIKKATDCPLPETLVIGGQAVDGRTLPARRYKTICGDIASDMGGADNVSTGQWLLIHRAAGLTVQIEKLECVVAAGKPVDVGVYTSLTSTLIRTLNALGLRRRARDVSPAVLDLDPHAAAVLALTADPRAGT